MNLDQETIGALGYAVLCDFDLHWYLRDWAGRKVDRPRAPALDRCEVCEVPLQGRQRAVCGPRCKDRRKYRRRRAALKGR